MNETQRRIKAYQDALPGLRERVAAVALLLVMSITMMTSATFAWLTISRAPEVSGVNTTVAANGNLEIALANSNDIAPGESKVGDSSAAKGQTVTAANLTWGNLVNLSDASYGLSNIVLRPALLGNASNLLSQPLKSVNYGGDGRAQLYYNEDFQFTSWVEPKNGVDGYFKYFDTPQYGVRAISTVEYTYVDNSYYQYTQLMQIATSQQEMVKAEYDTMLGNDDYINALAGLIGDFMTDKLNEYGGTTDVSGYMEDLYNLLCEFEGIVDDFGDALVALANVQVYNKYGPEDYAPHTYTRDTFFAATASELQTNGVSITCLSNYNSIANSVSEVLWGTDDTKEDCIADFYARVKDDRSATVQFSEITDIVNKLVNINTCQIILDDGTTYAVGSIGMSAATKLLGKDVDAKITKGVLKDFEQLSGCKMCATNVDVKAKYIVTVTMTAKTITTSVADPFLFDTDVVTTAEVAAANKGDFTAVAQDTYGMALDFWVRTNASNSYLVLEGNVITKTESVRATGVDMDGNTVELYTVTISTTVENTDETTGETTTEKISEDAAVYYDSSNVLRNANNHSLIYNEDGTVPEGQTITTPIERYTEVTTVVGYEGENRVWEENIFLTADSTTQGSGSCYVFYAEDPAQQENSLRLLSNLRVAFMDCNTNSATYGKMVAMAHLDIANRYEDSGKVILPLKLVDDGSTYLTKNENGLAIIPLTKNEPTRLTAIVYLDGRSISNSDVLATNDIQGQLNIQFGSSTPLNTMGDAKLEQATRSVSAIAKKATDSAYGAANSLIEFDYEDANDDNPMTVDVKVTVTGDQPTQMTAFFMRKVNATQGSREQAFTLTESETEDGVWTGSFTFDAPGNYVLRTVQLDGVDYDLPVGSDAANPNYPRVSIAGFAINTVSIFSDGREITDRSTTIMTGDRSISANLSLAFSSDQSKLPSTVRLQLLNADGTQVTATMSYNATTQKWSGTANFTSSGVYTLKYVVMDGEYTELDAKFQKELTLYMGMTVRVMDENKHREELYQGESFDINVYVDIYDDTGDEIPYLTGARLIYMAGSIIGMDTDLKWNTTENCYTGKMQMATPGVFTFGAVTVGSSTLKETVNDPPIYTCISPVPPEYVSTQLYQNNAVTTADYILDTNPEANDLEFVTVINNAEAATITAVFKNADESGKEYTVTKNAIGTGKNEFHFTLPTPDTTGYQHGDWTLDRLELVNVYINDTQTMHTADNPLVWDMDDLHVQVVSVKVEVVEGEDETITKDTDGTDLLFMETGYSTKAIKIRITDQTGNRALKFDIADVKLQYLLDSTKTQECGGYTADHITDQNGTGENDTYTLTSTDNITYVLDKVTLVYAGEYYPNSLSFTVNGENYSYGRADVSSLGVPSYRLETVTPTVAITAISPTGSNATKITYTTTNIAWYLGGGTQPTFTATGNQTSSFSDYAATLYAVATADNRSQRHGSFTQPTLTMTVAGVDSSSAVSIVLPGGSASAITFSRTGNGAITKTLGSVSQIKSWTSNAIYTHTLSAYYGHGTQTISTMTVTRNGLTYTVYLENPIVINNPSSVNQ